MGEEVYYTTLENNNIRVISRELEIVRIYMLY